MSNHKRPGQLRRLARRAAKRVNGPQDANPNVVKTEPVRQVALSLPEMDKHLDCQKYQQSSSEGAACNNEDKVALADSHKVWVDIAGAVGGILFAHYAQAFFSLGHSIAGIWCTFGGTVMAVLIISHLLTHVLPAKKVWVTSAIILVVVSIVFGAWSYSYRAIADFTVVAETIVEVPIKSRGASAPVFWCVHRVRRGGDLHMETSPVHRLWYVKVTNNKDISTVIEYFTVENKSPDGRWRKVPAIDILDDLANPMFYYSKIIALTNPSCFIPDLPHANKVDFGTNFLQFRLNRKPIGPHESVEGWLPLDLPANEITDKFRFRTQTGETKTVQKILLAKKPDMDIGESRETLI